MDNFWTKVGYLVLGLSLGGLSGFCSTYHLDRLGVFWRPPLIYWAFSIVICLLTLRPRAVSSFILLPIFIAAYLASLEIGQVHTGFMVLGVILLAISLYFVLRLQRFHFLVVAGIVLLMVGLVIDLNFEYFIKLIDGDEALQHFRQDDSIGGTAKAVIIIWQTITLGAVSLQLYTEKLFRERQLGIVNTEIGE